MSVLNKRVPHSVLASGHLVPRSSVTLGAPCSPLLPRIPDELMSLQDAPGGFSMCPLSQRVDSGLVIGVGPSLCFGLCPTRESKNPPNPKNPPGSQFAPPGPHTHALLHPKLPKGSWISSCLVENPILNLLEGASAYTWAKRCILN